MTYSNALGNWSFSRRDLVVDGVLLAIAVAGNFGLDIMSLEQGRGAWNLTERLEYKFVIDAALMGIALLGWRHDRNRQNTLLLAVLLFYAIGDLLAPVALVPWAGAAYVAGHLLLIYSVLKLCKPRRWQMIMLASIIVFIVIFFLIFIRDNVSHPALYILYGVAVSAKFSICMGYKPYRPAVSVFFLSDIVGFLRKALFNIEPFHVVALLIYYVAILLYSLCMFYRDSKEVETTPAIQ